jgi:hypothetical protein
MKVMIVKLIKWGSGFILILLAIPVMMVLLFSDSDSEQSLEISPLQEESTAKVSQEVERYRPLFEKYARKYGLEQYVNILMALTMQESGGRVPDVMQSSESLGLAPNTITDPELSIDAGCKHFKAVLMSAKGDVDLCLQSYNFGGGFITWVQNGRGGKYTLALAHEFSSFMAVKMGWGNYGDPEYVPHVRRYLADSGGSGVMTGEVQLIMKEALRFQGQPYSWGGNNPSVGFDCSGLTQWTYKEANVILPRTAEEQYYFSTRITAKEAKAGDLVFFSGTYAGKTITHVGIYLGNGQMYNSNDSGVEYSTLVSGYWKNHLYGFGRVL